MSWCPTQNLVKWYNEVTSDDSGKRSLSKSILFWGMVSTTIFMWKLLVMTQLTPEYLVIYVAAISGHQLTSKWLDGKKEGDK